MDDKQRALLLSLGIDPSTGRKIRSDKGKTHQARAQEDNRKKPSSKMSIYCRVITRIKNLDAKRVQNNEPTLLGDFDENGLFVVIPAVYETKACNYKQVVEGRTIDHTVRRVCTQKEIDLEKYRFEALQEMAFSDQGNMPVTQLEHVRIMLAKRYGLSANDIARCLEKRKITWWELYLELYHISEYEAALWDYDTWHSHYEIAPKETLPDDFEFRIKTPPGTKEFMPEWQYRRDKLEKIQEDKVNEERERKRNQFLANLGIRPSGSRMTEQELRIEAIKNHIARRQETNG